MRSRACALVCGWIAENRFVCHPHRVRVCSDKWHRVPVLCVCGWGGGGVPTTSVMHSAWPCTTQVVVTHPDAQKRCRDRIRTLRCRHLTGWSPETDRSHVFGSNHEILTSWLPTMRPTFLCSRFQRGRSYHQQACWSNSNPEGGWVVPRSRSSPPSSLLSCDCS